MQSLKEGFYVRDQKESYIMGVMTGPNGKDGLLSL